MTRKDPDSKLKIIINIISDGSDLDFFEEKFELPIRKYIKKKQFLTMKYFCPKKNSVLMIDHQKIMYRLNSLIASISPITLINSESSQNQKIKDISRQKDINNILQNSFSDELLFFLKTDLDSENFEEHKRVFFHRMEREFGVKNAREFIIHEKGRIEPVIMIMKKDDLQKNEVGYQNLISNDFTPKKKDKKVVNDGNISENKGQKSSNKESKELLKLITNAKIPSLLKSAYVRGAGRFRIFSSGLYNEKLHVDLEKVLQEYEGFVNPFQIVGDGFQKRYMVTVYLNKNLISESEMHKIKSKCSEIVTKLKSELSQSPEMSETLKKFENSLFFFSNEYTYSAKNPEKIIIKCQDSVHWEKFNNIMFDNKDFQKMKKFKEEMGLEKIEPGFRKYLILNVDQHENLNSELVADFLQKFFTDYGSLLPNKEYGMIEKLESKVKYTKKLTSAEFQSKIFEHKRDSKNFVLFYNKHKKEDLEALKKFEQAAKQNLEDFVVKKSNSLFLRYDTSENDFKIRPDVETPVIRVFDNNKSLSGVKLDLDPLQEGFGGELNLTRKILERVCSLNVHDVLETSDFNGVEMFDDVPMIIGKKIAIPN